MLKGFNYNLMELVKESAAFLFDGKGLRATLYTLPESHTI